MWKRIDRERESSWDMERERERFVYKGCKNVYNFHATACGLWIELNLKTRTQTKLEKQLKDENWFSGFPIFAFIVR